MVRGGSKMVIKGEARVVEDDAGQVLEFESKMMMGGMPPPEPEEKR